MVYGTMSWALRRHDLRLANTLCDTHLTCMWDRVMWRSTIQLRSLMNSSELSMKPVNTARRLIRHDTTSHDGAVSWPLGFILTLTQATTLLCIGQWVTAESGNTLQRKTVVGSSGLCSRRNYAFIAGATIPVVTPDLQRRHTYQLTDPLPTMNRIRTYTIEEVTTLIKTEFRRPNTSLQATGSLLSSMHQEFSPKKEETTCVAAPPRCSIHFIP